MPGAGDRDLSFGSNVLVSTTANLAHGFPCSFFQSRLYVRQLKPYGIATGLVHVKTTAVFITRV